MSLITQVQYRLRKWLMVSFCSEEGDRGRQSKRAAEALDRERKKELKREIKWLHMLAHWDRVPSCLLPDAAAADDDKDEDDDEDDDDDDGFQFVGKRKMRERIRKGVPDKLRAEVNT